MATIGNSYPSLVDLAKQMAPDGTISDVAELMSQDNLIIQDMPWMEGNLSTGHRGTIRTGLPTSTWRKLYGGTAPTKGRTAQIVDTCGELTSRSHCDAKLLEIAPDAAKFRMNEAKAHIQGMSQEYASTLFYGNETTDEEEFTGLAPRYNSLSADNADNIISAGGSQSDNSSIWLISWGEDRITGLYPKGTKAGLNHKDLGLDDVLDGNGNPYQAYKDHFEWNCGLHVKDWRYGVRICNIDISNLTKDASSGADLIEKMVMASTRLPTGATNAFFYCNRTVEQYLRLQVLNKSNVWLGLDEFAGKKVLHMDGFPIRRVDALTETEAAVS